MDDLERDLIEKAQAGDRDAFTQLILWHEGALGRMALSALKEPNDAADAIQETILRAWKNLPRLRQPQFFRTWLIRILLRECATLRKSREKYSHAELPDDTWEQAAPAVPRDTVLDVRTVLETLSRDDRMILTLYYFDDFPVREIAEALHISQSAAKQRLHRAREKFRAAYEERGKL